MGDSWRGSGWQRLHASSPQSQKGVEGRSGHGLICRGCQSAFPVHPSVGRVLVRRAQGLDALRWDPLLGGEGEDGT